MSGKTSNESKSKYNAKAYDFCRFTVKKGRKEMIEMYAKEKGFKSFSSYINSLIDDDMKDWALNNFELIDTKQKAKD